MSRKKLGKLIRRSILIIAIVGLAGFFLFYSPVKMARFVQDRVTAMRIGTPVEVKSVSVGKYAYSHLDTEGKKVYDQLLSCMLNHEESVSVSTRDEALLRQAFDYIFADYGGLFWVDGYQYQAYHSGDYISGISFIPSYVMSFEDREAMQAQIDEVANSWLFDINPIADDYTKTKYIYERLINEVEYVADSPMNQNIISVFVNKQTVCQGYAMAATYLLSQLGVHSTIVTGTALDQPHAWNLVQIDGNYYYLDVTWGNSTYRDGNTSAKMVDYAFLNVTSADMADTHISNMDLTLPECSAKTANYFVREELFFDSWEPEEIGDTIRRAYEADKTSVSVKLMSDYIYNMTKKYFFDEKHFGDYCEGLSMISYFEDPDLNVITFKFK